MSNDMVTQSVEEKYIRKEYSIPWIPTICSISIFLIIFVAYCTLILGSFLISIYADIYGIVLLSIILFSAILLSFSILIHFWMNLILYPVKKWLLKNTTCHICNNKFSKCDYHHPRLYFVPFSFAAYCDNCKKDQLLEAGLFDKTVLLIKRNSSDLGYIHSNYKVPWQVLTKNTLLSVPVHVLTLIITEIIFAPFFLLYIYYYNNIPVSLRHTILKSISIITAIIAIPIILRAHKSRVGTLKNYSIRKWILKNVKCKYCNGTLSECNDVETKLGIEYSVFCNSCKKNMALAGGTPIDPYVRFENE